MQAAIYRGPRQMQIEDVPMPRVGPGDILVQVKYCAICGTDIKTFDRGHPLFMPPCILGHEFSGLVVEVGPEVTLVQPGDRVVVAPFVSCGHCYYCQRGLFEICINKSYPSNGAFAQYVTFSQAFAEKGMVRLPEGLSMEAAALAEPLACALNSVLDCQIAPGDTVLVLGAGPMGLLNMVLAQLMGARVLVSEVMAERRALAAQMGANVIDPGATDLRQAVRDQTGGRGADAVIIAVGLPALVNEALTLARPGGVVNIFGGCPQGSSSSVDPNRIHYQQVKLIGSFGFTPGQFKTAAELIASGQVNLAPVISHRFPFAEIGAAFAAAMGKQALKVVLSFD